MSFHPYSEYKDSGVEWLGSVPSHWDFGPIKHFYKIVGGTTPKSDVDAYWNGSIIWVTPADLSKISGFDIDDSERKITELGFNSCGINLVPKGSLILSTRAPIGTLGIATQEVCTNQGCKSLIPSQKQNSKFLAYLLSTATDALNVRGRGTTFLELSADELGSFRVPFPNEHEQAEIIRFLDFETAKIDSLVAEQEKLIELLKEKRQAVISHAVTRGLDASVKMKDSGIDWLGQVPIHWDVRSLKHLVDIPITDGPHETPEFLDEGVPFVSAEAVSSGIIDFKKIRGFISRESHEKYSFKYQPKRGDIYMVKSGATTGICAIVETDLEFNIWSPLAAIRCSQYMEPYFVLNFIRSKNFQEAITLNWSFGTQQNIGMGVIENLRMPTPPKHEQRLIANHLDKINKKTDSLLHEVVRAISSLKERRTSLISAAVTGQIDVRNAAAELEAS